MNEKAIELLEKVLEIKSRISPDYSEHTIKLAADEMMVFVEDALILLNQAEAINAELLTACETFPAPNIISVYADFAEECSEKPSMAIYKAKFNGLCAFLRSCEDRAEKIEAAIAKYQSSTSVEPEVRQ